MTGGPEVGGGSNARRALMIRLAPGHATVTGLVGPCEYVICWSPRSIVTCLVTLSADNGVISNRTDGSLPPGPKNKSRIAAARWNCARSPGDIGGATSPAGCSFQFGPAVFTNGRNCVLKYVSSRPPGANSLAKSSSGMSLAEPAHERIPPGDRLLAQHRRVRPVR